MGQPFANSRLASEVISPCSSDLREYENWMDLRSTSRCQLKVGSGG
jgi:hypothetical protein